MLSVPNLPEVTLLVPGMNAPLSDNLSLQAGLLGVWKSFCHGAHGAHLPLLLIFCP